MMHYTATFYRVTSDSYWTAQLEAGTDEQAVNEAKDMAGKEAHLVKVEKVIRVWENPEPEPEF